jgi:hypothetical protein
MRGLDRAESQILNEAFDTLFALSGKRPGSVMIDWAAQLSPTTAAPIELWIDAVNGNDHNDGDQTRPLKTLGEAKRRTPIQTEHSVVFRMKRGVYPGALNLDRHVSDWRYPFVIQGEDFDLATGLTGPNVGAFTAAADAGIVKCGTATMGTANWATNELVGLFIQILSGPSIGLVYPIASNDATTIETSYAFPAATAAFSGASFQIVRHAVKLTGVVDSSLPVTIAVSGSGLRYNNTWSHLIKNIEIDNSGNANTGIAVGGAGTTRLEGVKIKTNAAWSIAMAGMGAALVGQRCWIESQSSNAIRAYYGGYLAMTHSYFKTPGNTAIRLDAIQSVAIGGIIDAPGSGTGITTGGQQEPVSCNNLALVDLYIRNCAQSAVTIRNANVIVYRGRLHNNLAGIDSTVSSAQAASRALTIHLSNATIDHNTIGINLNQPHGSVTIEGTVRITDNSGPGVILGEAPYASHMSFSVLYGSTVIMTNNGLGSYPWNVDFLVSPIQWGLAQGVQTKTWADVQAATHKIILVAENFNRIVDANS